MPLLDPLFGALGEVLAGGKWSWKALTIVGIVVLALAVWLLAQD